MTYKAIIADDEIRIIQLIELLGHWNEFGIEIVDRCTDGRHALQSILRYQPDFVISDIKMPDLDGIQLMEESRKAGLSTLFILISGYRHFEYARSAVELNAVDYLLKPVNEEQLNRTLGRTCRLIDETRRLNQEKDEYRRMKDQQDKTKQDSFWRVLIHPENNPEYDQNFTDASSLNAAYNFSFREGCWQIVFLTTNMYQMIRTDQSVFEEETAHKFNTLLGSLSTMYYLKNHFGYNIILNFEAAMKNRISESINALFYSIRDLRDIYGDFTLHMGVSEVHENANELKDAFIEARSAEWGRFSVRFDSVLFHAQLKDMRRISINSLVDAQTVDTVCSCLKYQRRDELAEVFDQIHNRFRKMDEYDPGAAAEAYFRLIDPATLTVSEDKRNGFSNRIDSAFLNSENYSQLIRNTFLAMDGYIESEQASAKQKNRRPIAEAVYYISMHYQEQISQTDVAEACNISPAYMSRLFKEETGVGFQDYLTRIRMENAEKMLAETNLSVKEIALAVGYPDEKYFSKLYKKLTGIKPSEYRKIYG